MRFIRPVELKSYSNWLKIYKAYGGFKSKLNEISKYLRRFSVPHKNICYITVKLPKYGQMSYLIGFEGILRLDN